MLVNPLAAELFRNTNAWSSYIVTVDPHLPPCICEVLFDSDDEYEDAGTLNRQVNFNRWDKFRNWDYTVKKGYRFSRP